MGLERRNFLKMLGATGLTLVTGSNLKGESTTGDLVEFNGILYDSTRCKGCHGCEYDCAEAHNMPMPAAEFPDIRQTSEVSLSVVNTYETGKGKVFIKKQCMHCNEPACATACLTKAMHKDKTGPVTWDGNKCMGCRYCMVSCPFDMPKFEYNSTNPKILKCDMCVERMKTEESPACVFNCPNEALMYGKRRDLIKEARRRIYEKPDLYIDHIYGEHEAGGTGWLYLSSVPFDQLGLNTLLQNSSYPALTKGFLYSVPSIFVLVPTLLLGINQATKNNHQKVKNDE